MMNKFKKQN